MVVRLSAGASDAALLAELGTRIARTRLERDWTQAHLAQTASVGLNTLRRLENGDGATLTNLVRVLRALDLLDGLDAAIPEPAPSPIEQMKLAGRRRRRASGRRPAGGKTPDPGAGDGWTWGDEAPR